MTSTHFAGFPDPLGLLKAAFTQPSLYLDCPPLPLSVRTSHKYCCTKGFRGICGAVGRRRGEAVPAALQKEVQPSLMEEGLEKISSQFLLFAYDDQ